MRKSIKISGLLMLVIFIASLLFTGCDSSGVSASKKDYDLYIFSSKGEITNQFEAMCKAYETEKGIKIKLYQIGSGTDHMEPLRIEMNSSNKPSIFSIQGLRELNEWETSCSVMDLNTATVPEFINLANNIPENLKLTLDGKANYGIPYNIEGYGYIVDKQMVTELFPSANVDKLINDIKLSSYDEFEKFVIAVDNYIKNNTSTKVILNSNSYELSKTKTNLTKNLTGVFSVAGAERWTYSDHMMNVTLGAIFKNPAEARNATDEKLDSMKGALTKYMKALDFKTSHAAGNEGALSRGADFINTTTCDYNKAIQRFAQNKALFIKQGNWANTNIEKINPEMTKRLVLLPVKMPMASSDIKCEGMNVEKFNSSIPVYVPNYFAINNLVSPEEQKLAQEFLVWLNTSETGKHYITNKFDFIPYNADKNLVLKDSINDSILSYVNENKTLPAAYHGITETWSKEVVGLELMEKYMTKPNWTTSDYENLADFAIKKWKELRYPDCINH
ncbi:MAG: carbohydrate ABC transporter substrate-binding protein [Eubacteriales bacterium SKADARSKE-1]|nr:carbohydrate ABC transporter substrate-binding protein [Eubacteriales bacterium SKADARSKE-1]